MVLLGIQILVACNQHIVFASFSCCDEMSILQRVPTDALSMNDEMSREEASQSWVDVLI